jgi:hypothetical protein
VETLGGQVLTIDKTGRPFRDNLGLAPYSALRTSKQKVPLIGAAVRRPPILGHLENCWMREKMGMYRAMTTMPTVAPRKTISRGSSREVSASTLAATSES